MNLRNRKRPRKYGPGEPIATGAELLAYAKLPDGHGMLWVGVDSEYSRARAEHAGWTMNQAWLRVERLLQSGSIRRAVLTDEYREWLKRELEQ